MRISDWSSDVCSSDLLIVLQSCSIHASTGSAHGKFAQPCRQERVRHRSVKWSWRAFRKDTGPRRCQCRDRGAATREPRRRRGGYRSEEHTSELQSLMRLSYAVFCLNKKKHKNIKTRNAIALTGPI